MGSQFTLHMWSVAGCTNIAREDTVQIRPIWLTPLWRSPKGDIIMGDASERDFGPHPSEQAVPAHSSRSPLSVPQHTTLMQPL